MDQHWTQTEVDPTPEQWLALHLAFRRYCEAKPWERLANEDVLAVNDPLGHFKGYCVALGDGGLTYGLGVYLGDLGLLNYLTTMTSEDEPNSEEMLERSLALTAVLGDREELENKERKAMRDLGLRYRGRGRWPIFRSAIPGHWPWYGDEARFLTIALDNVRDVAERVGQGMLDLYAGRAPSEVPTQSLRDGVWRDEWEPLRPPVLPVEDHQADTDRLRSISRSTPIGSAVWEVTASYIPTGAQDGRGTRTLPAHAGHGSRGQLWVDPHRADAGTSSICSGEAGTSAGVAGAGGPVAGRIGLRSGRHCQPAGTHSQRAGHRVVRWTYAGIGFHQG